MAQINKPTDYFNTKLYTGTGSTQSITGVGFQPDWVWIKNRSRATSHWIVDSVRGASQRLQSNTTSGDSTQSGGVTSFDSNGFSIGTDGNVNTNTENFASWNWLAGGTASSNTDGSITSSVSANTTAGFSIVSYTGTKAVATVGHGLGAVPKMIIIKNRDDIDGWGVYHAGVGNTGALELNSTSTTITSTSFWNDTTPTSSVFTIKSDDRVNPSSQNLIAYCFAEKKGFSKFDSYTGNGNADGPFIYTGFKPAFVIAKGISSNDSRQWIMFDNKRNSFNPENLELRADSSGAEVTQERFDFLSNGIKITNNLSYVNGSGETYIYMAFAENPLVGTNNIPATAR